MLTFLLIVVIVIQSFLLWRAFQHNKTLRVNREGLILQAEGYASYQIKGTFHIGDLLSVASMKFHPPDGVLMSPRERWGVREFLTYVLCREAQDAELRRECLEAVPCLLRQFPWLESIPYNQITPENWEDKLADYSDQYGKFHYVETIHGI